MRNKCAGRRLDGRHGWLGPGWEERALRTGRMASRHFSTVDGKDRMTGCSRLLYGRCGVLQFGCCVLLAAPSLWFGMRSCFGRLVPCFGASSYIRQTELLLSFVQPPPYPLATTTLCAPCHQNPFASKSGVHSKHGAGDACGSILCLPSGWGAVARRGLSCLAPQR